MNTKATTKIDLSKCEVGQKLRRRDGRIVTFDGRGLDCTYPFRVRENCNLYRKQGEYFAEGESPNDIVEILPLEKPAEKVKPSHDLAKIRKLIAEIKAGHDVISEKIKQLEEIV